jgi:hypothetical protein
MELMENKYNKNIIVDEVNKDILFLEFEDLIEFDRTTGSIKVDKDIFDAYVENSYIEIEFMGDNCDYLCTYKMIAEDDEGIYMELID